MRIIQDFLNRKNQFNSTQGKESEIMKRVLSNNKVEINHPTSLRYYNKGANGRYEGGGVSIDNNGGKSVGKPSTAVQSITYNPKTEICTIVFKEGDGKKYDYKMSPTDFESFMNASSKGRYVSTVMKYYNHL